MRNVRGVAFRLPASSSLLAAAGSSSPIQNTKAVKKVNKNQLKSQEMKSKNKKAEDNLKNQQRAKQKDSVDKKGEHDQKKDGPKNKSRRKRKEPTGEDKRFLSTRPVKKSLTEEELKCPTCIDCEKGFTSQSGYYHHQRLHKRGREFTCKECNKGFLCRYSLKQHERLHEGPTNFCDVCERHFSKNGFIRHMQIGNCQSSSSGSKLLLLEKYGRVV
uniref:Zinc finger protein 583-like n=1 Tax=Xiphophorus maculatus TaxID=8083 RepID=A0A3B5QCN6_XIPMA